MACAPPELAGDFLVLGRHAHGGVDDQHAKVRTADTPFQRMTLKTSTELSTFPRGRMPAVSMRMYGWPPRS